MGSAALLHPLLSLPTPSPRIPSPRVGLSSSSLPFASISRAPPLAFGSATIRRCKESREAVPKASSEEEGAVGDLEAGPEEEGAPGNVTAEENSEDSEAEAEEKPPRRPIVKLGDIMGVKYSPNIKEIKVVNHRKVRRARLYYLRDKLPRLSTFK
ncbi:hypothetical protein B296_00051885 [Ensete ventricosum]|uniref:50S ribosomal protein L19 n=1 Tax=Ensete ventricosum TaxID=4639 RepID=A0A426X8X3_ENSVE|nr:hypothetical protein B296_00051885 [Ensete ventricosum]